MTTITAALILIAILGLSAAGTWAVLFWAIGGRTSRDQIIRAAHERAETTRDWDAIALAWDLPAYQGPEPEAALERLREAVTDEQHEGEL